jgi:hypothetical protein
VGARRLPTGCDFDQPQKVTTMITFVRSRFSLYSTGGRYSAEIVRGGRSVGKMGRLAQSSRRPGPSGQGMGVLVTWPL